MEKGKRFAKALAGVAVVGWILGLVMKPQASVHEVVPAWGAGDIKPRPSAPRKTRDVGELVYTLGPEEGLYKPSVLRVDAQENLYVLDFGDTRIRKYGPDGAWLATFGQGFGTESGQLTSPTDFDVSEAGDLWVTDAAHDRITIFAPDASVKESFELETSAFRLALRSDGGFFVMPMDGGAELFAEYDPERRLRRRFGRLLASDFQASIALDGWISVAAENRLVFAPTWIGVFAIYGEGDDVVLAETVDRAPLPTVVKEKDGWERMNPQSWALNKSSSTAGSEIFLYTIRGRGPDRQGFVDVFDVSGAYSRSLLLSEPGPVAVVGKESVFTIHEGLVKRWKLPEV